mgnify:CR=1 FL=1
MRNYLLFQELLCQSPSLPYHLLVELLQCQNHLLLELLLLQELLQCQYHLLVEMRRLTHHTLQGNQCVSCIPMKKSFPSPYTKVTSSSQSIPLLPLGMSGIVICGMRHNGAMVVRLSISWEFVFTTFSTLGLSIHIVFDIQI